MTRSLNGLIGCAVADAVLLTRALCSAYDYVRSQDEKTHRARQIALMRWELCDAPLFGGDPTDMAPALYDLGFRLPMRWASHE